MKRIIDVKTLFGEVAILYSSSQNSLIDNLSFYSWEIHLPVAILYSSSQNSLLFKKGYSAEIIQRRNPLFIKSEFSRCRGQSSVWCCLTASSRNPLFIKSEFSRHKRRFADFNYVISRNPLFIKSEFSRSPRTFRQCEVDKVAILYSSSQNSLPN